MKKEAKKVVTQIKLLSKNKNYSLLDVSLKTGRTHQIRVHSAYMHHPIVGDKLYNPNKCKFNLNGQLLHAKKLILSHPRTKEVLTFECDLPDYFKKVLTTLNSKFAG